MNMDLGGELILEVCLDLLDIWMATYSYLRCCHRLCQKGDGLFSMKRIQENWVNIRLPLISLISFFHTLDSGKIWYLWKDVFKEYPMLLRAR